MNEALKTIENLAVFLSCEIARVSNDPNIPDETFKSLQRARITAVNLHVELSKARGFLNN